MNELICSFKLNVDDVWRIPSEVDRKDAAMIIYGHSTALYTFSKLTNLKENQRVMISAGPAGLGLAAVDVAANVFKAKVSYKFNSIKVNQVVSPFVIF